MLVHHLKSGLAYTLQVPLARATSIGPQWTPLHAAPKPKLTRLPCCSQAARTVGWEAYQDDTYVIYKPNDVTNVLQEVTVRS